LLLLLFIFILVVHLLSVVRKVYCCDVDIGRLVNGLRNLRGLELTHLRVLFLILILLFLVDFFFVSLLFLILILVLIGWRSFLVFVLSPVFLDLFFTVLFRWLILLD
jgi:hypothetical protein